MKKILLIRTHTLSIHDSIHKMRYTIKAQSLYIIYEDHTKRTRRSPCQIIHPQCLIGRKIHFRPHSLRSHIPWKWTDLLRPTGDWDILPESDWKILMSLQGDIGIQCY